MKRHIVPFVLAAIALVATRPALAQDAETLFISAFAVNMGSAGPGGAASVDITVDRWSTAEEREQLITVMLEKGPDALLKALRKQGVKGRFRIPGLKGPDPHHLRLGLDLRYAWQVPLPEGGRRIVVIADRYIGFQEARTQPRTMDYPFTLIEMRVGPDGKGEGKMSVATKISFDKKERRVELENYSSEPVRLNALQVKAKATGGKQ